MTTASTPASSSRSVQELAARLRQKAQENAPPPRDFNEIYAVRARINGVLIQDARLTHGLSEEQCAEAVDVPVATLQAWQMGDQSQSLPQLEMLAYFIGVPVSHFWDTQKIASAQPRQVPQDVYTELRDRVIGTQIRLRREAIGLDEAALAAATGLTAEQMSAYEMATQAVPISHLSSIAVALKVSLNDFLDDASRVGDWLNEQEDYQKFSKLSDDLRAFVTQPGNRAYLDLAVKLSKLPLQDLRQVGESILDITF